MSTNSTIPASSQRVGYLRKKHRRSRNAAQVLFRGAKDGVRTRDLDLGKVALYQLSYFRVGQFVYQWRIVDAKVGHFCHLSSLRPEKISGMGTRQPLKTDSEWVTPSILFQKNGISLRDTARKKCVYIGCDCITFDRTHGYRWYPAFTKRVFLYSGRIPTQ